MVLLRPGLGLKRWLLLLMLALVLFSLGVGFAMAVSISPKALPALRMITLAGLLPIVRGAIFILAGSAIGGVAVYHIYRWVILGSSQRYGDIDILTAVDLLQHRQRGPHIVAIGGGTGVSTLLRGLKRITGNLTAIVTITDDGGSSGRLRHDLDMPAPGDARSCLVALSESGPLLEELFDYRFKLGSDLNGHNLGNLLLAALFDGRGGLQEGLDAAAQLLTVSGKVVPVSNNKGLILMGETVLGDVLRGETAVGHTAELLRSVWLEPKEADTNAAALEAIRKAELIVIGPGSLFTSVIPNFLLREMREAMAASQAPKVFVCNVATQKYETEGFGVQEHLDSFQMHTGVAVSHVLVNSNVRDLPEEWNQVAVQCTRQIDGFEGDVMLVDVVDETRPTRHDPEKTATVLRAIAN